MGRFPSFRIVPKNPRRLVILLAALGVVLAGDLFYRRWRPGPEITTAHYVIRSSASPEQTRKMGEMVEILYATYAQVFTNLPPHLDGKMQMRLFRDRNEFRRVNRSLGWAEAFYREPFCNAYYSAEETNPYHWMLHEATHQLNNEVAHFQIPKWTDEGLATYFSTSTVKDGALIPSRIDRNTYPIWWLSDMALTGDIQKDIASHQIIPLRAIVTGSGGPSVNEYFNLYYIHWWSLSHFLLHYEGGKYREPYFQVIRAGGTLDAFEKHLGPIDRVQGDWYAYLRVQAKTL